MKKEIHPDYHKSKISCACGATYEVGSTLPEISIELCAACHPFYTGNQKIVDSARRVEKFKTRTATVASNADKKVTGKKVKREKRTAQKAAKAESKA